MIYITGDTHGDFSRLYAFCQRFETSREDIMIILGDAGFNFFGGQRDQNSKRSVSDLPITVFSIHGNHEMRPATLPIASLTGTAAKSMWRMTSRI